MRIANNPLLSLYKNNNIFIHIKSRQLNLSGFFLRIIYCVSLMSFLFLWNQRIVLSYLKSSTMAEFLNNSSLPAKAVHRPHKKSTRVDLTPMVDLGFLLICFFVFTSNMAKPVTMQINQPNDKTGESNQVCNSCALTVLLDSGNAIHYYEGAPENAILKTTDFSEQGIRKILLQKRQEVVSVVGNPARMVVIIKPMPGAQFKNFVDMVDELNIMELKLYYIDEVKPADQALFLQENHYRK